MGSADYGQALLNVSATTFFNKQATAVEYGQTLLQLQGSGGAIRSFGGALLVTDTDFWEKSAATVGGAIMFNYSCLPVTLHSTSKNEVASWHTYWH